MLKAVFRAACMRSEGFGAVSVKLMGVELAVPEYSTGSQRQSGVVLDTAGLAGVFDAGGWCVRKYWMARGRRRIWRKLHLGVDETRT